MANSDQDRPFIDPAHDFPNYDLRFTITLHYPPGKLKDFAFGHFVPIPDSRFTINEVSVAGRVQGVRCLWPGCKVPGAFFGGRSEGYKLRAISVAEIFSVFLFNLWLRCALPGEGAPGGNDRLFRRRVMVGAP